MDTDELRMAIIDLKKRDEMLEYQADSLAKLVMPRLEKCNCSTLKDLKRRLSFYNTKTMTWGITQTT